MAQSGANELRISGPPIRPEKVPFLLAPRSSDPGVILDGISTEIITRRFYAALAKEPLPFKHSQYFSLRVAGPVRIAEVKPREAFPEREPAELPYVAV
jgi:hypothetical protein